MMVLSEENELYLLAFAISTILSKSATVFRAEKEVLEKVGITQLQFQQAIMRHQESPAIQQAVMMMQVGTRLSLI